MTTLESAIFRRLMRTSVNVLPLSQLIEPLQEALPAVERQGPDVAVSGLCSDSRAVVKGDLFIAGIGTKDDGLCHVEGRWRAARSRCSRRGARPASTARLASR